MLNNRSRLWATGALCLLISAGPANAVPLIDIHLAFVSGPLSGTNDFVRLEVDDLPPVGGSDKKYNPKLGSLKDLDATIAGRTFDETDDVAYAPDSIVPGFRFKRTALTSGVGVGRSFDIVLETISGAKLNIFIFGDAVGGPSENDDVYQCYFGDGFGVTTGPGPSMSDLSACIVTSIEMSDSIDDLTGNPGPAPLPEAIKFATQNLKELADADNGFDSRDFFGREVPEPGTAALVLFGVTLVYASKRRGRISR